MELNKFVKGDVLTSPFLPQTKCIFNLIGTMVGASASRSNTNSTNATNLRIAQLNNEFNERMFDKQIAFNQDMFDQQIAYDDKKWREQLKQQMKGQSDLSYGLMSQQQSYNSAVNQRKRLEQAGLNPYLMMSGGNAGTVSSQGGQIGSPSGGAPSALGVNPPTASEVGRQMQDQSLGASISGAAGIIQTMLDNLAQKGVRRSQQGLNEANTKTVDALRPLQVEGMTFDNLNKQRDKWLKDNQLFLDNITFPDLLRQRHAQTNLMEQEVVLTRSKVLATQLESFLNYKELQYFDANAIASLAVKAAEVENLRSQGYLNYKQAKVAVANAAYLQALEKGVILDNSTKERIGDFLVSKAKHDANYSLWQANDMYHRWRNTKKMGYLYDWQIKSEKQEYGKNRSWFENGSWISMTLNEILNPFKGILGGNITKTFK